jgi:hypothetical protein
MDAEKLTREEEIVFRMGQCPDCGGTLKEGPSGGMSINMLCGGLGESRFNFMGIFGVERTGWSRCPKVRKRALIPRITPPGFFTRFLLRLVEWSKSRS